MKKKITAILVSIALLGTLMVFPVSATSSLMLNKIGRFPYLYHGVRNGDGVRALQKFLLTDVLNAHFSDIDQDGLDGGFGPHLEGAVRDFQVRYGIYGANGNGTGEVYTQTWTAIANILEDSNPFIETPNGIQIYKAVQSGLTYFYYNNSKSYVSWSSSYFANG